MFESVLRRDDALVLGWFGEGANHAEEGIADFGDGVDEVGELAEPLFEGEAAVAVVVAIAVGAVEHRNVDVDHDVAFLQLVGIAAEEADHAIFRLAVEGT